MNEKTRELLRQEYYDCGRAESDMEHVINEMWEEFDYVIDLLGCEHSWASDWSYTTQCHGISIEPKDGTRFTPKAFEELNLGFLAENDWVRLFESVWQPHYQRLVILSDCLEHYEAKDYQCPCYYWENVPSKWQTILDRYEIVSEAYEKEIKEALEDVCEAFEESLREACDYIISDEAADDWIEFQLTEEGEGWLEEILAMAA